MKISFALGHELPFPPDKGGGVNSLLDGLSRSLANLGHEVTAYSPSAPGHPNSQFLDGVRHVRVPGTERRPNNLSNVIAGVPYALRLLRTIEPCDILSSHLWHGFFFSGFSKARVVTHTVHRDPKKYLLLFSLVDRIYTGSDAITEAATRVVPSLGARYRTIHNAVDFTGYPGPSVRPRDGFVRFLFVGRFSADKGLATFIPAFCEAAVHNPGILFKSVGPLKSQDGGDEALLERMRAMVHDQGMSRRCEFLGPVYDRAALDEVIREADVVVLPSVGGETLNMGILECMRIGRALLVSDLPANAPLAIEGETGFFARAGDQTDWKERILEIARDHDRLESFGLASFEHGLRSFSCDRIAREYVRDFEELLILSDS